MSQQYASALAYFNQNTDANLDDLHYTYDSEQNVLIQHHKNAAESAHQAKENAAYAGIATLFAASSSYEAIQKDDWATHGPDWSLGFMAIFTLSALAHVANRKRTLNTVNRNIQTDRQDTNRPIL